MHIEVRIRHQDDTNPRRFTEWPLSDLDGLLNLIKRWGIETEYASSTGEDVYGQFVVSDSAAFFEIVVGLS